MKSFKYSLINYFNKLIQVLGYYFVILIAFLSIFILQYIIIFIINNQNLYMEKKTLYKQYRQLQQKIKAKRIKQAKQIPSERKPNPQGDHKFFKQDFIEFKVYQEQQLINLKTYLHYKSDDLSDAKAVIIMFHGLNSYIGHGAHIAKAFEDINMITVGFDHRGFGKSEGNPGYVQSFDSHLYDASQFVNKVFDYFPNLPKFLLGLSMGGMTCYHLALRQPQRYKGVVLMAPAMKNIVGGMLVSLVNGLGNLLPNKFRLIKPPRGQATRNIQITEDVENDKYSFSGRACLKTIQVIIQAMEDSPKTFSKFKAPFVIIQGGLDKLVNPEVAFQLYDNCASKDKELWFYENMWHDVWHQEQIHEIIEKLKVWFKKRID